MFSSVNTIFYIIVLLMSVVVHEVAHGVAALRFGDQTAKLAGRLTLNPIKHLDIFGSIILPIGLIILTKGAYVFGWAKPVPYNPANLTRRRLGSFVVAAAGIFTNLMIVIIFTLVLYVAPQMGIVVDQANPNAFTAIVDLIIFVNLLLAFFNLIPVPPLDGSKILFSILPQTLSFRSVENFLDQYALPILIIFIFFIGNIIAPVVFYLFNLLIGA